MLKANKKLTIIVGDIYKFNATTPLQHHLQYYNKGYSVIFAPETYRTQDQQREIAKAICASVRKGIKIILLTNSGTIVKEINTLIMFGREDLDLQHLDDVRKKFNYGSSEHLRIKEVDLYELKSSGEYEKDGEYEFVKCKKNFKWGLEPDIFSDTIIEMQNVQDSIRFGLIHCGQGEK